MRSTFSVFTLASAAAFAVGCDSGTSPIDTGALLRAEARWSDLGPTDYTIETRLLCFCPDASWARITVQADSIVQAIDEQGDTIPEAEWGRRMPVSASFAFIRDLLQGDWDDVDLAFDQVYGYPTNASFDPGDDVLDGGAGIAYRNLVIAAGSRESSVVVVPAGPSATRRE